MTEALAFAVGWFLSYVAQWLITWPEIKRIKKKLDDLQVEPKSETFTEVRMKIREGMRREEVFDMLEPTVRFVDQLMDEEFTRACNIKFRMDVIDD